MAESNCFLGVKPRPSFAKKGLVKGLSMPLNLIVVIAIAVLALASLTAVFFSGSAGQISDAEAQRIFASGCSRYCIPDFYGTYRNAYVASQNDPDFIRACERLQYGAKEHLNRCFDRCGNCFLNVTESDLERGYEDLLNLAESRPS